MRIALAFTAVLLTVGLGPISMAQSQAPGADDEGVEVDLDEEEELVDFDSEGGPEPGQDNQQVVLASNPEHEYQLWTLLLPLALFGVLAGNVRWRRKGKTGER